MPVQFDMEKRGWGQPDEKAPTMEGDGKTEVDLSQVPSVQIWDDLPKHFRNKKKVTYIRNHSDIKLASRTTKFSIIIWKNYLRLKRCWISTLVETLLPVLAIAILTICVSFWPEGSIEHVKYTSFGVKTASFKNCTRFIFIPKIPIIVELMESVKNEMDSGFEFEMKANVHNLAHYSDLCAAIVFTFKKSDLFSPMTHFPAVIDYSIRMPAVHQGKDLTAAAGGFLSRGAQWDTDHLYSYELVTGPRNAEDETGGSPGYFFQGFLYLQNLVAEKIIRKIYITGYSKYANLTDAETSYNSLVENILIRLNRFPYPTNKDDQIIIMIHDVLPLCIVVSYLVPFMLIIYGSVVEKESGIRIQMKTVGIPVSYHTLAWILRCIAVHLPSVIIITCILCTNWTVKLMGILTFTSGYVFFFLMMAYVFKTIATSMLLVTFFRRATTATVSCGFLWIVSYVPYIYVKSNYSKFTFLERLGACLLGNTGISMGCHLISDAEARGVGVNLTTLFNKHNSTEFTVGWVIVVLVCSGLLEIFLSRYVARILPEIGITPLPWNYFMTMWYWRNQLPPDEKITATQYMLNSQSMEEKFPDNFEPESHVRRRKELQLDKITKYFGKDRILNKINLNCYEGHLTTIIGEKGSGKSTLLRIIVALRPTSKGTIVVSRQDMVKQMHIAKAFVGYCPSENIMYPYLTIEETLYLYSKLKCIRSGLEQWDEVERFVSDAMLQEYRYHLVSELTPSAMRMLIVACAFIGGSRVVLLDEPTKQMSAAQKRMTWDFVGKQKKHRTVIVAMESMNESDLVADRVVVLKHGEATCSGSIPFMQQKFSGGYHLIIEKGDSCDIYSVVDLVTRRVKDSKLVEESNKELNFFLPDESSPTFPGLFEELEKKSDKLGIIKFRNLFITMDEVLLNIKRIAMEIDYDPENRKVIYQGVQEVVVNADYKRLKGCKYFFIQFELLLMKNIRFTLRQTGIFVATTIAPLLFVIFCLSIFYLKPFEQEPSPLVINLEAYKNPRVIVDCFDSTYEGIFLCNHLKKSLMTKFKVSKKELIKLKRETIHSVVLDDYKDHTTDLEIPLVGVEVKSNIHSDANVEITGYFNNQPLHTPPVVLNIIDNAILDYMIGALTSFYPQYHTDKGFSSHTLMVTNLPLPYTAADHIKFSSIFISAGYFLGIAMSIGYSFLIASFVVLEVHEKSFKHLQMLAGASPFLFWTANYLWNFLHYSAVATLTTLIVYVFHAPGFNIDFHETLVLFVLLESYGACSVIFIGAWSLIPVSHWTLAFSRTFLFLIFTGPLFMLISIALSDPTAHAGLGTIAGFHNIFLFFPNYAMGVGIFYIIANSVHRKECGDVAVYKVKGACSAARIENLHPWNEFMRDPDQETLWACCNNKRDNDFDFIAYGIGRNLLCMLVVLIVCLCIRILKESPIWTRIKMCWTSWEMKRWIKYESPEHEIYDYDVLNEALRVFHGTAGNDLIIKNLCKEEPHVRKVDNLCVQVDKGQCFCLLGTSGAGKSATLSMIVGSRMPTSGDVTINGVSLRNEYPKYIQKLGYCPGIFPFLKELTGHETLLLIGALRRIPAVECDRFITNLSLRLLFLHDLDNPIKNYNAVSVRKLSAAVAMLGEPEVIVFDEPTNSIDLVSREYLFKSINALVEKGSIAIVTSNSVAECETICTKMAIMVNGTLRCFGTPQHLRDLFSEGFTVIAKFLLDPKKHYFTTTKDKFRIHERKHTLAEMEDVSSANKKYFEEDSGRRSMRVSITNLTLFPERSGQIAVNVEEEEPELILTTWEEDLVPFVTYFERNFPKAILVDKQPGFVHYHIRGGQATASSVFTKMEEAKILVSQIESYYIGQSNLDQVFLNFARGQRPYE